MKNLRILLLFAVFYTFLCAGPTFVPPPNITDVNVLTMDITAAGNTLFYPNSVSMEVLELTADANITTATFKYYDRKIQNSNKLAEVSTPAINGSWSYVTSTANDFSCTLLQ